MRHKRLSFFVFFNIVLIGAFAIALTSLLWVNNIYQTYQRDSERIREDYTNQVKDDLKARVDTIVSVINFRRVQTDTRPQQEEIKSYINQFRFGEDNQQYIFIHDFEGTELANGRFPELIGGNAFEESTAQSTNFVSQQITLARNPPHQGFLTLTWSHDTDGHVSDKLIYISAIPSWGWVIGSGADLEALNQRIDGYQDKLKQQLISGIQKILLVAAGVLFLSILAARFMSKKMNASIQLFTRNLEHNSAQLSLIDEQAVDYLEFKELAHASNQTTQRINHLLHRDELTGLYNRRYINVLLESLFNEAKQKQTPFSLVMLDIDHFKAINDNYGHSFGDLVLTKVAECIEHEVHEIGYAGRFGGEEIMLLLPNLTADQAHTLSAQIKDCVAAIRLPGQASPVTISGGVSDDINASYYELIQQADKKLYQAKESGRNRIVI